MGDAKELDDDDDDDDDDDVEEEKEKLVEGKVGEEGGLAKEG